MGSWAAAKGKQFEKVLLVAADVFCTGSLAPFSGGDCFVGAVGREHVGKMVADDDFHSRSHSYDERERSFWCMWRVELRM